MLATIWTCTQEWSLIRIRATAFTLAACHQPLSCKSPLTRSRMRRSFRLPRPGTLIRICATACAGVRRVSRSASSETGFSIRCSVSRLRSIEDESRMSGVRGACPLLLAAALLGFAGSAAGARPAKGAPARKTITVMTRNLYLGANLDPIVHATSQSAAFQAVQAGWEQVQANDFPTRANGIADEIARAKPDFVGFQELVLYGTKTLSDVLYTTALDYEAVLKSALRARRLPYHFVGVDVNTVAALPSGWPVTMDIQLTVRNGLLVRNGIRLRNIRTGHYHTT